MQKSTSSSSRELRVRNLTEAQMSARDSDVEWFEHQEEIEKVESIVEGRPSRRRWVSLLTGRADDSHKSDDWWVDKSRPSQEQKERFNSKATADQWVDDNQQQIRRAHPIAFLVSSIFFAIGTLALVVSVYLSQLASGGLFVNLPVWAWFVIAAFSVFACVIVYAVITNRAAYSKGQAIVGSIFVTIGCELGLVSFALFIASMIGK